MTVNNIIEDGDRIILDSYDLDKKLYKKLLSFLASNTTNGKVSISKEDLASLEELIYKEVKDSDYEEKISNYLLLFVKIEEAVSQQQLKYNGIKAKEIREFWNSTDTKRQFLDKVVYDLGQGGIKDYFVKGLAKVVRDANFQNLTIDDAVSKLSKVLIDDDYTKRYIKTVALDALNQYAGAINDAVRVHYDLNELLYVGNIIETSRPFCDHIKDNYKGRLTKEELEKVLKEYCPNGVPSDKNTTYTTVSGEKITKKKGSGMIEGTNINNFAQLRGGHGCRHEAIWVKKNKNS